MVQPPIPAHGPGRVHERSADRVDGIREPQAALTRLDAVKLRPATVIDR